MNETFRVIEWTKAEFDKVSQAVVDKQHAVALAEGVFLLEDVKAVVKLKPIQPYQPEKVPEKYADEYGFTDFATRQWLADHGVDIVNGGMEE
jgi:hypothetical protein